MKTHPTFHNLHILDHPLIQHKLTLMRKQETEPGIFRQLLREISLLMGYEVTRQLSVQQTQIETPLMPMQAPQISDPEMVVVPILRAGLGMSEGLVQLIPTARQGHIGLYRKADTKKPVEYLVKLPDANDHVFILVDPMLATGNTACYALDTLIKHGVARTKILFMALVAAPEGIANISQNYGDVPIYLASLDQGLDKNSYVIPGIGDVGDRLFGTL
ncbi:MAG: uracil phosphoribosyltransferase [Pseudomonadota bacterium]